MPILRVFPHKTNATPQDEYIAIDIPGDSFDFATKRLETIKALGFCPMAMLYRDFKGETTQEWHRFQRSWARPTAIYSPNWHYPLLL